MNYLDVSKSVIISAPAGSGKTEKLARRYIALLKSGAEVERILAITFTDKAAAEMKQRILKILKNEDRILYGSLLERMAMMRVSTIHSFCGTLIRRFSFEASVDPMYEIEDSIDSRILWEEILYEILMESRKEKGGQDFFLTSLSERGFRGLEYLKGTINNLFEKMPFSLEAQVPEYSTSPSLGSLIDELKKWPGTQEAIDGYDKLFERAAFYRLVSAEKYFLTKNKMPRKRNSTAMKTIGNYQDWTAKMYRYWQYKNNEEFTERAKRILDIFRTCFRKYQIKKALSSCLDFSDLEYITYKLLTQNPEWANILYAFDEKTDHILVDEFQDTNNFQWAIIDRLTEEWRSGFGAKREDNIIPTIFLVGDEKQSIYYFRGANVEIFPRAQEKLKQWLKDEFSFEELTSNYRSRPAIVDFTNLLFSQIMVADKNSPSWVTRYRAFEVSGTDSQETGRVELVLLNGDTDTVAETKQKEAEIIAKRILSLVGNFEITDRSASDQSEITLQKRPCRFMDIAILLRKRTHLKKYEDAFRRIGIPFVAVKGIGFYQEPEIVMLRAFVYFLTNPMDDYSLYILLKSPLFFYREETIVKALRYEGISLLSKLKASGQSEKTVTLLEEWLHLIPNTTISELIEKALVQTKAWEYFHDAQKRANVKKFIKIIEGLESGGKSLIKISDFLERTSGRVDEPKATVNTEGMNAVKIMTIHGAKGLEFPVVFVPGIEEPILSGSSDSLIYEVQEDLFFKFIPDSEIRKHDGDFSHHIQKQEEEQKRLFYVAVTRAEEALFLVGQWNEKDRGFLGFLKYGLGIEKNSTGYGLSIPEKKQIKGLYLFSEQEVETLCREIPGQAVQKPQLAPGEFLPIAVKRTTEWKSVTEAVDIKQKHGKDWVMLGEVLHRLFELVSKGILSEKDLHEKAEKMLAIKGIIRDKAEKILSIIDRTVKVLREKGIWQEVILPREDAYAELPFILKNEDVVYTGRIDRVLTQKRLFAIYDYKTFPVKDREVAHLLKGYAVQLGIYREAIKKLFKPQDVKSYIIFTHRGEIREVV
jgi:ATP-dependent helicase/nuclease subunit A